ncbi:HAD family hydrolase [Mycoplasma miroungirhinis]|uniref:HAD family hydrolase n=1 Tax=Mycoplasma miroungirhinis TaxID=754516 RepID=A0A6M4JBJ4_9MOLU|nr:HAD family hydrolase [Mycoplasma miroungirhinis]QJR44290.1 HAD family hydrolase [Mycoplasma miroungirhinis]
MNLKDLNNFIFDLDGTLLDSSKEINEKTLEAIKKLKKLGKRFSLNTGRTPLISMKFMSQIEPDFPCSFCNGAIIYDWKNKQMISKTTIPHDNAKQIIDTLISEQATTLVYTAHSIYYKYFVKNSEWVSKLISVNDKLEDEFKVNIAPIPNDFDVTQHEIFKILCITDEVNGDMNEIRSKLITFKDIYSLQSNGVILDIIPKNLDKGTGLNYIFNNGYAKFEDTCVFGDEKNDLPMFKVAGYRAVLGQARDEIKQAAQEMGPTWILDSNDDNGIGKFLEKLM